MKLMNKVAIVTGASSGIGYATSKQLAAEGAKVVVSARRKENLQHLTEEINSQGGTAVPFVADVSQQKELIGLVEYTEREFGGLDIAVNNAGIIGALKPLVDISTTEWESTLAINLSAMFYAAQAQVAAMIKRGSGSLIFISSFVGANKGFPNIADYAASKAGLIGLTKALAVELGEKNIRVNAVLPGGTDTPMNIANRPESGPEVLDYLHSIHALQRLAQPKEIAKAIAFLAADDASFITGATIPVDGGASINP